MKNIEIKTTQNVVLQYELANLRDRAVAFIIDMACLSIGLLILSMSLAILNGVAKTIFGACMTCLFLFYSLVMEVYNKGQSIGKMALRIQVIKTAGGKASFSDYVARWVFRMIDIYFSVGGIASIMIASSAKAQRIGDIVANTVVVKLIPRLNIDLNDLLTIHSQNSYKPVYLQAKQLMEEDALLIKTTLDRYQQFKNKAHVDALHLMAEKIKSVLCIESVQANDKLFLQTILNDYVVLTR